ncbi:CpsD/CapB family tyrosine-protein kinase [Paenibacillus senegalensis]|uniref:CpsD/CapB family tyrosine-protein kinase n=1 Tax=Paenibacillus senegalensis TaxID=1465766 RepID=UPI000289737B|nr:CpsD/CapB family tyrosine-protein kinase [Paenibacillus senegalensis]
MSRSRLKWPLITDSNPKSPVSEAYKILRTNIEFTNLEDKTQSIMITSTRMREGKSTTSANLAVAFSQAGKKVLLIDADMRKPTQHHVLGLSNRTGLSSALSNQHELLEAIQKTTIEGVDVLCSGPVPPNPSEMLASKRMEALLESARESYDLIILDTPPALVVADAQIVAARCDGVLLVVDCGTIKKTEALKAKQKLEHVNARMLGVVLNNVKRGRDDHYAYYYYGEREALN